jgi:ATP-dependent Lon protease
VEELRQRWMRRTCRTNVRKEAERELRRLERMPSGAPDHQVIRTYLELVLELPWIRATEDNLDLARARAGAGRRPLQPGDVKERILEHLGVLKLNPQAKAPILCFVGPPGVGKTSLGPVDRPGHGPQVRALSLGGLHDEAELRGHRRTYIGAMPGRIIQAMRRAGVATRC